MINHAIARSINQGARVKMLDTKSSEFLTVDVLKGRFSSQEFEQTDPPQFKVD
jgi:hypothetical protein